MDYIFTAFAEFKDKNLESKFFNENAKNDLKNIRSVLLISCTIFFLLFFYDYFFLDAGGLNNLILFSFIPRLVILIVSLIVFTVSKKSNNYSLILNLMSAFVLFIFAMHLFMASHFFQVELVFEALDVVLVILGLFFIPNRWLTNLIFSIIACAIFLLLSPLIISGLTIAVIIELTIYFFWFVFIIGMLLLRTNKYKRSQYAKGLELERLTLTDTLTNANNRKSCDNIIKKMCDDEKDFCIILFDVDDFKKINDTYGHVIGDEVLINMVKIVRQNISESDILIRWGGEEFIVLLNETSLEASVEIAECLCRMISSTKFENIDFLVTASFGVTEYIPGDNLNSIIGRADKLLYSAKRSGKNKVIFDEGLQYEDWDN